MLVAYAHRVVIFIEWLDKVVSTPCKPYQPTKAVFMVFK